MNRAELNAAFRAMPKVDLHCHLDGSLRPATVLELARERGVKLPADNVPDLLPFVQVPPTCRSLKECLDVFGIVYPLLQDGPALERVAYELCQDCAAENIRHVEVRFAPMLNAKAGFDTDAVVASVLKGLRRGLADFGVTSGVILCLYRSHGPAENRLTFETLKKTFRSEHGLAEPGVVGMDLAGDESRYPTMEYADFFEQARELGIPTTCHAGETHGTKNIEAALELSVRRIGHGINLAQDAALLAAVAKRRVPVEIGLSSNVRTKSVPDLASHPALRFHRAGVPVSLNTDDRGIFGIELTGEFAAAHELGFTVDELRNLAVMAADHAFLPAADRRRLRNRLESEAASAFAGARA